MSEFKVVLALQASDLGWIEWWMVAALAATCVKMPFDV